jgi:hypothetical protein
MNPVHFPCGFMKDGHIFNEYDEQEFPTEAKVKRYTKFICSFKVFPIANSNKSPYPSKPI